MKLQRYLKNRDGQKTEMVPTSVYLTKAQHDFIKRQNLNLSLMVRDVIDGLIKEELKELKGTGT